MVNYFPKDKNLKIVNNIHMKKFNILFFIVLSFTTLSSEIDILTVRGNVQFIREKVVNNVTKETKFIDNDIIKTEKNSFLRFKIYDSILTLSPHSYYQISTKTKKVKKIRANIGSLIYGHLLGTFSKEENSNNRVRIIKTTTASMGIRGTQILLHVTRNKNEYYERLRGIEHPMPTLEEITKLKSDPELFSQICCIEGIIRAATNSSQRVKMTEGQVINYNSMGSKINQYKYTKEQNLSSAHKLGLLFD